jgi:hypothetical protein
MRPLLSFFFGLLFAVGLGLGGMTQPAKVIGFLDVTGQWDPSLGLVMAGGLSVLLVANRLAGRMRAPLLGGSFPTPHHRVIDGRLIGGAMLFGLGWGLAGFCPGPAIVSFGAGVKASLLFLPAMLVGIAVVQQVEVRLGHQPAVALSGAGAATGTADDDDETVGD